MNLNSLTLSAVMQLIHAANSARCGLNLEKGTAAENQLEEAFQTSITLAVYGTLAPGRQNYHIVEPLGGEWTDGSIEGDLQQTGWGATLGYPAFRPREGGPLLQIKILTSKALPTGWQHVDDFEGPDYQRILVPVFEIEDDASRDGERRLSTVANLYAARDQK